VLEEELVRWVTALDRLEQELKRVASVCFEEPSVQSRFDGTGVLGKVQAATLGVVGMAARASWLGLDARSSRMGGVYQQHPIPVVVESGGDVRARAMVRWREILLSLGWLHDLLSEFPEGPVRAPMQSPAAECIGVGMVEGWRGEIVHLLTTDSDGQLCSVKVIDPSFHNWPGLALAMREEQISDFPLCNKSFNLSYAGHDL
jgi:Ni,Fe-hydrogenase III large subunit